MSGTNKPLAGRKTFITHVIAVLFLFCFFFLFVEIVETVENYKSVTVGRFSHGKGNGAVGCPVQTKAPILDRAHSPSRGPLKNRTPSWDL